MNSSSVLLLRLSAPLQAWGVQSRFTVRDTGREPSKSGVVGLLCAALGRGRDQPIDDLAALRMAARVDQEGRILRDYHVAGVGGYLRASGDVERKNVIPGNRYYLMDARFLVGLEGEDADLLAQLHVALRDPVWPLYLGRKACVPGEPVWLPDGLPHGMGLEAALRGYPWLGSRPRQRPERVRVVLEDPQGAQVYPDQPLSFAERRFGPRRVRTVLWQLWPAPPIQEVKPCISRA
jgi:CRISPR system Cascade subunit CasD